MTREISAAYESPSLKTAAKNNNKIIHQRLRDRVLQSGTFNLKKVTILKIITISIQIKIQL